MIYQEDLLLAGRAVRGDESAFEEIVERNQNFIYNLCMTRLASREDALDLSQETFIRAYNALSEYRGESKLSSWLYRICINCISDHMRSSGKKTTVSIYPDEEGEGGMELVSEDRSFSPEESAELSETTSMVRQAIAALPPEWRDIIVMREYEGMSYAEIAGLLGIEEGTVKSRLNRAKIKIKEFLIERNFSP